jgi:neutral ceramidase
MRPLLVGVATADITPPVGIDITGFCLRGPTTSRHRSLELGALVFSDGDRRAALVCCDILNYTVAGADEVRARAAAELGEPPEAVMLCCSHTHSAPALEPDRKVGGAQETWTEQNETYRLMLAQQVAGAVRAAAAGLEPARIAVSRSGSAPVAVNRRVRLPDGTMIIGRNPDGPVDRSVGVVRIDRLDGSPLASVVDYACHPIALGPESEAISPDYVGAVREVLERATGAPALFVQGCAGDLAPVEGMGADPAVADHLGRLIGYEAAKLHEQIETRRIERREELVRSYNVIAAQVKDEKPDPDAAVRVACRRVVFPLDPLPDEAEAERLDAEAHARLHELEQAGAREGELNIARVEVRWTQKLRRRLAEGADATVGADVQALAVNDVLLLALPVEPFTRIGTEIRSQLGADTVLAGYANGTIAYCPLPENYPEGGYEVDRSYRLYGLPARLAPEAAELLTRNACELAAAVRAEAGAADDGGGATR